VERVRNRSKYAVIAGAVAIASGAAIVIATIAVHSFSSADAGERSTDLVRSELTAQGLARHRADFDLTKAAVEQLYGQAFPAFAQRLGMTPTQFDQQVLPRYPAVAQFAPVERRDAALRFAERVLMNLERHEQDFADADAIPVSWLPMSLAPWLAVLVGIVLVAAGAIVLVRPSRLVLAVVAAIGLALVIGPLVTRFPQKANAAKDLLDSLTFSDALAAKTRAFVESGKAATDQLEHRAFPDLAAALNMTPAQLDEFVSQRFPAIATARSQFDDVFRRYDRRARIREVGVSLVPKAQRYPLTAVVWWALVPGILIALTAGVAVWRTRVRETGRRR
jgi:hypothetical protein